MKSVLKALVLILGLAATARATDVIDIDLNSNLPASTLLGTRERLSEVVKIEIKRLETQEIPLQPIDLKTLDVLKRLDQWLDVSRTTEPGP